VTLPRTERIQTSVRCHHTPRVDNEFNHPVKMSLATGLCKSFYPFCRTLELIASLDTIFNVAGTNYMDLAGGKLPPQSFQQYIH
jgi:hypothetical protein